MTTSPEAASDQPAKMVRRRQDPVSCRLCRLKKLKCSRTHPCSNCVARNAVCEFEPNQTTTLARIQQDVEPSNSTILQRLSRLEDMILRMSSGVPSTPESLTSSRPRDAVVSPAVEVMDAMEASHQIESAELASIATRQPSLFPAMSTSFVFEAVPLLNIEKLDATLCERNEPSLGRTRKILLPTYDDARSLFDQYAKFICHFHHIVHLPTLSKLMERFYLKIAQKEPVDTDHAALLLSVFATVLTYQSWTQLDCVCRSFQTSSGKDKAFVVLFRSVLDLLDHSRRVLAGSVEIVQAAIITLFLDFNLEGFTSRARALLVQALLSAKELGMHKLDCPSSTRRRSASTSIDSMIELEMKRRIWWHLVASDWMISLAGGAQEGTYNTYPQQMRVRLPRNIDDEVLDRGNTTEDLPLSIPSAMNYPLHRIRLGELTRSVVDTMRFGLADPTEHDYAQVMLLDKRVQNFIDDLPIFLRLDPESIQKSQHVLDRYPFFAMQRYIVSIGAHSVRCKLHQPFLVRTHSRAQYAPSAEICIRSAIEVIEISKSIRTDPTQFIPERVKLRGLMHHMFLATVVLVMDLCFNRTDGEEDHRKNGVAAALRMLEEAKDESVSVSKFLDSLCEALRKHHVRFKDELRYQAPARGNTRAQMSFLQPWLTGQDPQVGPIIVPSPGLSNGAQTTMPVFEDAWQDLAYQSGMNGMPDWDQLFSELDTFIA